MGFLKRGFLSVTRMRKKNGILFLLVFLLGVLLSGAISIRNAVTNTVGNLSASVPPVSTLRWNYLQAEQAGLTVDFSSWERPTVQMIREVASLSYVKDYDISLSHGLYSRDLEWVIPEISADSLPADVDLEEAMAFGVGFRARGAAMEHFPTMGVNSIYPIDFQEGLVTLVNGRFMTQAELDGGVPVVLISRTLAEANQLDVGSVLRLENRVFDFSALPPLGTGGDLRFSFHYWHEDEFLVANQIWEMEVVGIFDVAANINHAIGAGAVLEEIDLYNRVYMPIEIAENTFNFEIEHSRELLMAEGLSKDFDVEDLLVYRAVFLLQDGRDFRVFSEAAADLLPPFWEISDLSENFRNLLNSMDNMLWVSDMILWGTTAAAVIILSLLIVLFLKDRKQELGIYLSLGERKLKIALQILLEVLSVSLLAIALSLFVGQGLSNALSTHLLEQDLLSQLSENQQATVFPAEIQLFSPGPLSMEEMLAAYETSLSPEAIALFFATGTAVIVASSVVPIIYTLRVSPRKVLL